MQASPDLPANTDEMLQRIERAWTELNRTIARLEASPNPDATDVTGWTAADHLVNLLAWERSLVNLLQGRPRHEALGVSEDEYLAHDVDALNERIRARHGGYTRSRAIRELHETHAELLTTLNGLTYDNLQRTYSHYLPDEPGEDSGEPVLLWVMNNSERHYDAHRQWIEDLSGDPGR